MNSIPLLFLAAHMVGDFITQNQWMSDRKLSNWRVRWLHVSIYTLGFVPIPLMVGLPIRQAVAFILLIFITHFLTDSRRWASGDKWPLKPLMVDQSIHIATLALIASAFGI